MSLRPFMSGEGHCENITVFVERIPGQLSYGIYVIRTTGSGLSSKSECLINGKWKPVKENQSLEECTIVLGGRDGMAALKAMREAFGIVDREMKDDNYFKGLAEAREANLNDLRSHIRFLSTPTITGSPLRNE